MAESPDKFTEELIAQLKQCAKAFYDNSGALFYESKTAYKNQTETFDNIRSHDIDVYYNNHIVRFSYYPHVPLSVSHSVLTCSVSLEKTDSKRLFYPLSQLYGYFELTPSDALTIPLILSAESMKKSFDVLAALFSEITPQIRDLSYDEERKAAFFNSEVKAAVALLKTEYPDDGDLRKFTDDARNEAYPLWKEEWRKENGAGSEEEMHKSFESYLSRLLNDIQTLLESDKQDCLSFYYRQLLIRGLGAGYEAYMTGNYTKAVKKLKKLKCRTRYENNLIKYMEDAKEPRAHVPDSIFINLTELYKDGIPKNNLKVSLAVAPAMLLFGIMWLPPFTAVYFLFYLIESRNAVYLLGPLVNAPSVMLPAMLMGIVMIYFKSKTFFKIFFKKNYQRLIELENATFSRATHKFMKVMAAVILTGSVVFLFLTVRHNIKLTQNGLYDNTRFWSVRGSYYTYGDIDKLYYRKQTPNGYGDTFPYPSYVIRFKDGTELDPYDLDTLDEQFLKILRDKGVFIEEAK